MANIVVADKKRHATHIRELYWEYLQWANEGASENLGFEFDIAALLEADMEDLANFMPPKGCLLISYNEGLPVGTVCMHEMAPVVGEIKRMYVRPACRRKGIGRMLVQRLLSEARTIGYQRVRLDSPKFMKEAHSLYRAAGFKEIGAYEGTWVPQELHHQFVFMEIDITSVNR